MDYTRNFGTQHENVARRIVYQDARNSSPYWRPANRTFHPLTQRQFENGYKKGDDVTLRLDTHTGRVFIETIVLRVLSYHTAQQVLGSYNADDTFNGAPFTHVLVLDH